MNEMSNLIKLESRKILRPVIFTTVILTAAMCVLSCTLYKNYTLQYDLEAWEVGTELFSLLYPLIAVVPLCWNLYYERKNNFLLYVLPRVPIKKYLTVKWCVYALGAFCLIAIPYMLSAVFAIYVKAPVVAFSNPFDHVFQKGIYPDAAALWGYPLLLEGDSEHLDDDPRFRAGHVRQEYLCDPHRTLCLLHTGKLHSLYPASGAVQAGSCL